MLELGKDGRKNAFSRLLTMGAKNDKSILQELYRPGLSGFGAPNTDPVYERQRLTRSWIICRHSFCLVIFFFIFEVIFIFVGIGFLGIIMEPALFMITLACVAIITLSLEWWNRWIWRESSPMQLTPNVYKSHVHEISNQLEQQQAILIPPGNSASNIPATPVVHVVSPYGESIKTLYPNGGGYKGRIAATRHYDKLFICNYILLVIIYIACFFCLLVAMIWIANCLTVSSNDSAQRPSTKNESEPTGNSTETATATTDHSQTNTTKENDTTSIAGVEEDEKKTNDIENARKDKINALKLVNVFIVTHFILLILRIIVFLYLNKVDLCSLLKYLREEERNCEVPIVVRLQNHPLLPELTYHSEE